MNNFVFLQLILITLAVLLYLFAIAYLKKSEMEPTAKGVWALVILLIPVFGALTLLVVAPKPIVYKAFEKRFTPPE